MLKATFQDAYSILGEEAVKVTVWHPRDAFNLAERLLGYKGSVAEDLEVLRDAGFSDAASVAEQDMRQAQALGLVFGPDDWHQSSIKGCVWVTRTCAFCGLATPEGYGNPWSLEVVEEGLTLSLNQLEELAREGRSLNGYDRCYRPGRCWKVTV